MLQLPLGFEIASLIALVLILAADLFLAYKRPHVPSVKEATLWVVFYVALALVFAGLMLIFGDAEHAGQFLAGWLTEYSLSIDNLFVFIVIMSRFSVPKRYQQEALMVGIIIALVLRGIFILVGAQLIETLSWIFYIFGAFLLFTAWRQAFGHEDEGDGENGLVRFLRKRIALSPDFDGAKVRTTLGGKRVWTPMIIVFIALGSTDLLFALDSIPAIFGITQSPFIVFTANVFALMGLRQLYFLLGGLLEKLVYLKYGIAFILAFIGVKLVLHALHENELFFINGGHPIEWAPDIGTWTSLAVIVGAMAVATVASLLRMRADSRRPRTPVDSSPSSS
ncbi:TerC family protein [Humibacter sp. BT305]|uniref:Tellurium resistance protein TerC n=1 Tax=Cnuibacter physcomitrellae TaxID=1619308 RepID=A0A1X9LNM2_9MICO|nr:TerC family protein [Cnuibacter physcomitrellae]ARJ05878.1 tellurium resistance protein TerC [Cnuibacter physcomitrellae]AXH35505.1 TerC family protein [Humibacter sp. BT305]MCS5496385.1 TerC family protein [Cnuibacter physcomitrellae]GGI36698.1 tellurium resistance protein TerC [Cnuibacter physcomitrellae]